MKQWILFLVVAVLAAGCKDEYDDSEVRLDISALEQRMEAVEKLCEEMNTNIGALQALVNALEEKDFVTRVAPVMRDEEVVGYTIVFEKAEAVTIYHGEKGEDGTEPVIGVKQDEDGMYYWTVDGEWLLADGEKVRTEGKEGVTPRLKVEGGYWYVSYDGEASWERLGAATAEGGEAMFKEVTYDEYSVYFTLADGTTLTLPMRSKLDIAFAETEGIACLPGKSVALAYTVTGGDEGTQIECLGDKGWDAEVSGELEGTLMVTAPNPMTEGKVLVFATNGAGQVTMKALRFTEGVLSLVSDAYELYAEGGTVDVEVNTDISYDLYIPEEVREWIALLPETRAEMRTDVLRFKVAENLSGQVREATIELRDAKGNCMEAFTIIQYQTGVIDGNIVFADKQVEQICVERFDTDGDAKLSLQEAAAVTDVTGLFHDCKTITSFNEFQYFTGVKEVPQDFCGSCENLVSIILPEGLASIGVNAFIHCSSLKTIRIPESVTYMDTGIFAYCSSLESVNIPKGITAIKYYTFAYCSSLKGIEIPAGVTSIENQVFAGCTTLVSINIPEGVTSIEEYTFHSCYSLPSIDIPASVTFIRNYAFYMCNNLKTVYCQAVEPPVLEDAFGNFTATLYVPVGSKEKYQQAEVWKNFETIEEMDFSVNN